MYKKFLLDITLFIAWLHLVSTYKVQDGPLLLERRKYVYNFIVCTD